MAWKWGRVILTYPTKFINFTMAYGALVPYGARGAVAIYNNRKRARYAYSAARTVYRHRNKIRKVYRTGRSAARSIQRVWRKSRRARMAKGVKSTGKSTQGVLQQTATPVVLKQLFTSQMPDAPPAITAADFNVRERATVKYSGYKICRMFENRGGGIGDIYAVNYVMIQWKNNALYDSDGGLLTLSEIRDSIRRDFFRDTETVEVRTKNFTNSASSAQLWDPVYNCAPMNPNKQYNIIFRKKFTLYPRQATNNNVQDAHRNFKKFEFYMPIKKMVQFKSRTAAENQTPFMEIFWYNTRSPGDWPASGQNAVTDVQTFAHHTLYYR